MEVQYRIQIVIAFITAATAVCTTLLTLNFNKQQRLNESRAKKQEENAAEYKAIANGVKAILWLALEYIYKDAMNTGFISIDDLRLADTLYCEYHTLGGNGTGTTIYQRLHDLPNERIN